MKGKSVPGPSLVEREQELLTAIRDAGVPAAELFGDARSLAVEDVGDLATTDELVRTSGGGGLRSALREIAGAWVGLGVVISVIVVVRQGWLIDLDVAHVLIAVGLAAAFLGWRVGRAFFATGRVGSAVGALIAVAMVVGACLVSAVHHGPGHIAAGDVPVPVLAAVILGPAVIALVVLNRRSQQALRENWDDDAWFRRFRGGLRAGLMDSATARDHVAEVRQALDWAGTTAYAEFGHPLSFARDLAAVDQVAVTRRWWIVTTATTVGPLLIVVLILRNQSWGMLTVPIATCFVLGAVAAFGAGWNDRPRGLRR